MSAANYVNVGRWMLCYHCEAIVEFESGHYCGAPWQTPAHDMPTDWIERAKKSRPAPPTEAPKSGFRENET